jgi:hypothetical protein
VPPRRGPKCRKCGRATYVNVQGIKLRRLLVCSGCVLAPGSCTCKPVKYQARHAK